VRLVVADTGPLHYLVLVDAIMVLPQLYGTVVVPEIVCDELKHPRTPAPGRTLLASNPAWLVPRPTPPLADLPFPKLGDGERTAIALAQAAQAVLVLMDDREGVAVARAQGLQATGTLGVLELAAMSGLTDLPAALQRLKATNFRYRPALLDAMLARHRERGVPIPKGSPSD
jgi:predicted nucleic acid-binding protein